MTGTELIIQERQRQIRQEGWAPEHDAQHQDSELAFAACYYAMPCMLLRRCGNEESCPVHPDEFFTETGWDKKWAKRGEKSRIRQLVVAGALIAAEIDRLQAVETRCIGLSLCGGPCDESCPSVRIRNQNDEADLWRWTEQERKKLSAFPTLLIKALYLQGEIKALTGRVKDYKALTNEYEKLFDHLVQQHGVKISSHARKLYTAMSKVEAGRG